MIEKAFMNGVFLWMLVRNASHLQQPLDDIPFTRLKQVFQTELQRIEFRNLLAKVDHPGEVYQALYYDAENIAFSPRVIRRSFSTDWSLSF